MENENLNLVLFGHFLEHFFFLWQFFFVFLTHFLNFEFFQIELTS
jgi:hypothetical protein